MKKNTAKKSSISGNSKNADNKKNPKGVKAAAVRGVAKGGSSSKSGAKIT